MGVAEVENVLREELLRKPEKKKKKKVSMKCEQN
jgi:hypothetical protein